MSIVELEKKLAEARMQEYNDQLDLKQDKVDCEDVNEMVKSFAAYIEELSPPEHIYRDSEQYRRLKRLILDWVDI